jgi:hypothetical protein
MGKPGKADLIFPNVDVDYRFSAKYPERVGDLNVSQGLTPSAIDQETWGDPGGALGVLTGGRPFL